MIKKINHDMLDRLSCAICLDICNDPVTLGGECKCLGRLFCFGCIEKISVAVCPTCRGGFNRPSVVRCRISRQRVERIRVRCPFGDCPFVIMPTSEDWRAHYDADVKTSPKKKCLDAQWWINNQLEHCIWDKKIASCQLRAKVQDAVDHHLRNLPTPEHKRCVTESLLAWIQCDLTDFMNTASGHPGSLDLLWRRMRLVCFFMQMGSFQAVRSMRVNGEPCFEWLFDLPKRVKSISGSRSLRQGCEHIWEAFGVLCCLSKSGSTLPMDRLLFNEIILSSLETSISPMWRAGLSGKLGVRAQALSSDLQRYREEKKEDYGLNLVTLPNLSQFSTSIFPWPTHGLTYRSTTLRWKMSGSGAYHGSSPQVDSHRQALSKRLNTLKKEGRTLVIQPLLSTAQVELTSADGKSILVTVSEIGARVLLVLSGDNSAWTLGKLFAWLCKDLERDPKNVGKAEVQVMFSEMVVEVEKLETQNLVHLQRHPDEMLTLCRLADPKTWVDSSSSCSAASAACVFKPVAKRMFRLLDAMSKTISKLSEETPRQLLDGLTRSIIQEIKSVGAKSVRELISVCTRTIHRICNVRYSAEPGASPSDQKTLFRIVKESIDQLVSDEYLLLLPPPFDIKSHAGSENLKHRLERLARSADWAHSTTMATSWVRYGHPFHCIAVYLP